MTDAFDHGDVAGALLQGGAVDERERPPAARHEAASGHETFRLTYGTLADEDHETVVPGIGITAFTYVHHGTLAEAFAHLIAYRRGRAR